MTLPSQRIVIDAFVDDTYDRLYDWAYQRDDSRIIHVSETRETDMQAKCVRESLNVTLEGGVSYSAFRHFAF